MSIAPILEDLAQCERSIGQFDEKRELLQSILIYYQANLPRCLKEEAIARIQLNEVYCTHELTVRKKQELERYLLDEVKQTSDQRASWNAICATK